MRTAPLRYLAAVNERVLPEDTPSDFTFKYVDISQVDSNGTVTIPADDTAFGAAPSRARRLAEPGSAVVSTVRTYLRAIATVPPARDPLVFSTGFAVLRPLRMESRFFGYACRSDAFVNEVVARSVGVSYPAISPNDLLDIHLPTPDPEEQRRIADFLDDRLFRIDQITDARRHQAVLLDLARTETLRQLTGGERDASTWSHPRVAHVFRTGSGSTPPSDRLEYYDGGVPWVNTGDVRDGLLLATARTVTDAALKTFPTLVQHPAGSLVIAMYGQGATKGRAAMLATSACVNQACCVLIGDSLHTRWAFHWFRAHKREIVELANGAGQPNLSQEIIRNVRMALPPDRDIGRLLDEIEEREDQSAEIQKALSRQIRLLQEFKQSLITAAVAGELDVSTSGSGIPG